MLIVEVLECDVNDCPGQAAAAAPELRVRVVIEPAICAVCRKSEKWPSGPESRGGVDLFIGMCMGRSRRRSRYKLGCRLP